MAVFILSQLYDFKLSHRFASRTIYFPGVSAGCFEGSIPVFWQDGVIGVQGFFDIAQEEEDCVVAGGLEWSVRVIHD